MKEGFSEILSQLEQEQQQRLVAKVPQWGNVNGIRIPGSLALEQCSSAATAIYKASLAPDGPVADLTSGLGVDVWAFANHTDRRVFYNDLNTELCEAARENFRILGLDNVEINNLPAEERLDGIGQVAMIFIDPARRSSTGSKVFRLEDCSPNLLELLPKMWEHTETIMAKLSPMADISMISRQLPYLSEVHIIGTSSDCKEFLCIMKKGWNDPVSLTVAQFEGEDVHTVKLGINPSEALPISGNLESGDYLYEPYPALAKAGLYSEVCHTFGLRQLSASTHLYTTGSEIEIKADASLFFKTYRIIEIAEFCKKSFAEIGRKYPEADVSARNIPMRSEELKKRMGIRGSSDIHIFGVGYRSGRVIIVTERM